MANKSKPAAPDTSDVPTALGSPPQPDDGVTEDEPSLDEVGQLRVELAKARARNKALEDIVAGKDEEVEDDTGAKYVNARRLTHPHDIERFWRLGKLSPTDVVRFQATGQLPKPKDEQDAEATA